jgi:pyruvate,water dikinase
MLCKGNKAFYLEEISSFVNVPPFLVFTSLDNFSIDSLSGDLFAVRSSSPEEDSFSSSNAGKFDSFLFIKREEVFNKVSSLINKHPVIVQEMIIADFSGVCFTNIEKHSETYYINNGLCSSITGGTSSTVNFYRFHNNLFCQDFKPKTQDIFNGSSIVSVDIQPYSFNEDLIKSLLFPIVDSLCEYFNFPLDIEFSVKNNICYVLQVRPIVSKLHVFEGF